MKKIQLTLRARLTVWMAALLIISGIILVIIINSTATTILPDITIVEPDATVFKLSAADSSAEEVVFTEQIISSVPPSTQKTPFDDSSLTKTAIAGVSIEQAVQKAMYELQVISVIALIIIVIIGTAGAYWLSNKSLAPVHQLSQTIKQINVNNLSAQIPTGGPNDEVQELAGSFNTMLKRLDEVFCQQRYFAANAAHELRTPLTILQTNLEVLRADPDVTPKDYERLVIIFERTVERMRKMIDDLLVMSNDEKLQFKEKIKLNDLIQKIILELNPLAQKYQVSLQLGEIDIDVRGMETLLYRAFSNVIENGIRYNRPGGSVSIVVEKQPGVVLIHVTDTGVGIAKNDQEHLFEPFYRIEQSRSRHTGGSGLGLAVAILIIKRHGGDIHIASELGTGSTFSIKMPA
ncbi:HAMP domain-containing histidine kinase [Peptococcaceae bacterium]|nr:HAMP domain-containing histidine kinase [Peptococcaceae bacterium]